MVLITCSVRSVWISIIHTQHTLVPLPYTKHHRPCCDTQNLKPLFEFNVNLDISMVWYHMVTWSLGKDTSNLERVAVYKKRNNTAWPNGSDEDVDHVRQPFIRSPKKSISWASAQLQMPQETVHRILWKSLCINPYKLHVVQKFTACYKQHNLQFAVYLCLNFSTL
jgi:hypothetical protein